MLAIIVALAAIALAYGLYSLNPEAVTKWTNRGKMGWYAFIGVLYVFVVIGLLVTGNPVMVVTAGVILFVMAILVLTSEPYQNVRT